MSPPSPTSAQAYRRHLARTSRGRNFTQRGAPPPDATTPNLPSTQSPPPPIQLPVVAQWPPARRLLEQHTPGQHVQIEEGFDDASAPEGLGRRDEVEEDEDEDEEGAEEDDITGDLEGDGNEEGDGEGAIEEEIPQSISPISSGTPSPASIRILSNPQSSSEADEDAFNLQIPDPSITNSAMDEGAPREIRSVHGIVSQRSRDRPVPESAQENYGAIVRHLLRSRPRTVPMEVDTPFDATGLKEIGNLASWTVSSCKPGCGVEALRDEDTNLFWQSDGPQPHHLNIHFSRLVSILSIRIFLDFKADESYTPTRIALLAGTGYHDLIAFSSLELAQPNGWHDIPLDGVGGDASFENGEWVGGNVLRAFLVQVKIVENHQNGKDTHVRGLRIYARDEKTVGGLGGMDELVEGIFTGGNRGQSALDRTGLLAEPEWMGEPELR